MTQFNLHNLIVRQTFCSIVLFTFTFTANSVIYILYAISVGNFIVIIAIHALYIYNMFIT